VKRRLSHGRPIEVNGDRTGVVTGPMRSPLDEARHCFI
jgi:hypothetical protein